MKKVCFRVICLIGLVSFWLSLLLIAPVPAQSASTLPKAVAIATHPKGTSMNAIGSGLAKVISLHTPISAVDRPFTGYITWVPLLDRGSVDMGLGGISDFYYAYRGMGDYKKRSKNLRHLSMGTMFKTGYIARADSGIKTIADLRGKRATLVADTMITKLNMLTIIRAAGLEPGKDVIMVPAAGVAQCVDLLVEGRADAAFASVGMGKVKEASAKIGGVYWLPVSGAKDDAAARFIRKHSPTMDVVFIKAGSAPDVSNDFWFLQSPLTLTTHKGLGDETAFQIAKAIWENQKELSPVHPMLKGWVEHMVQETAVIPYHPGAIKFYKEVGAWSDKMDKLQQELLSE